MDLRTDSIGGSQQQNLKKLVNVTNFEQTTCADELSGVSRRTNHLEAREKLNKIKASNGLTYKEARATLQEIENKYKKIGGADMLANKYFKQVQDPSPTGPNGEEYHVYRFHYDIDVNKLPEPDRTNFKRAQAAVEEIERNNSALVDDVGPIIMDITF